MFLLRNIIPSGSLSYFQQFKMLKCKMNYSVCNYANLVPEIDFPNHFKTSLFKKILKSIYAKINLVCILFLLISL